MKLVSIFTIVERFFLNLKLLWVSQQDYANLREAMTDMADCIVGFCKNTRLQAKLEYFSPNAFKRESATQPPIDVFAIT